MSANPIPTRDEDSYFLCADTRAQGISPEAFLARQARHLREHLERTLHPDVAGPSLPTGLQMNRTAQLAARQQWMRLRLFPTL